ncbi:hypothetical protein GQ457_14G016870 [Hibiscus cannabinus]
MASPRLELETFTDVITNYTICCSWFRMISCGYRVATGGPLAWGQGNEPQQIVHQPWETGNQTLWAKGLNVLYGDEVCVNHLYYLDLVGVGQVPTM